MNLKIWTEEEATKSEIDQLFLSLHYVKDDIHLCVVNRKNEIIPNGHALIYDNDYRVFILVDCLNDDTPIKTDAFGNIILVKLDEIREKQKHDGESNILSRILSLFNEMKKESTHH